VVLIEGGGNISGRKLMLKSLSTAYMYIISL
jgi:hypothetical protein